MIKQTKIVLTAFVIAVLALAVFVIYNGDIATKNKGGSLSESEARAIAEKTCIKGGESLSAGSYNENSKTWWFDANLNATQQGCNPACVVSEDTRTAKINPRCTGLIPDSKIKNFDDCVAAGNPVMESYPRKCSADGKVFIEKIEEEILCSKEQRDAQACAEIYDPVCATVEVQCKKAPCDPIKQTFSNSCEACRKSSVKSYISGECKNNNGSASEDIRKLFVEKYPKYKETLTLKIENETENHARGSVSFEAGAPGGIFLAARIDGAWQIVFDGNGQIPCNISKYGFPGEMLKDCA